jgi:hypothetical protein
LWARKKFPRYRCVYIFERSGKKKLNNLIFYTFLFKLNKVFQKLKSTNINELVNYQGNY